MLIVLCRFRRGHTGVKGGKKAVGRKRKTKRADLKLKGLKIEVDYRWEFDGGI